MKTSILKAGKKAGWSAILIAAAWACQNESVSPGSKESMQAKTQATAVQNTQILATAVDVFDMTAIALNNKGVSDGRIATFGSRDGADDFECRPAFDASFSTISRNDSIVYKGTLTLDYGAGIYCKDSTEFHKGKITDEFVLVITYKDSLWYSLKESVTFAGFQKDSVAVDGVFSSTSSKGVNTINIQNAKLTYEDGTAATLNAELSCSVIRDNHHHKGSKTVTGDLIGTSREGVNYTAATTTPLFYDYDCSRALPVSGIIDLTIGSTSARVDYGTGDCDNKYSVTVNDSTTVHTLPSPKHHHY